MPTQPPKWSTQKLANRGIVFPTFVEVMWVSLRDMKDGASVAAILLISSNKAH